MSADQSRGKRQLGWCGWGLSLHVARPMHGSIAYCGRRITSFVSEHRDVYDYRWCRKCEKAAGFDG